MIVLTITPFSLLSLIYFLQSFICSLYNSTEHQAPNGLG